MKRSLCVVVAILIMAMALPGLAGEKSKKKCDGTPDEYKKKLTQKLAEKPWLGIEMDSKKDGHYTITKVISDSPAEKAGFEKGDVLLAINGQDYSKDNMKAVKKAWSELKPGSKAKYTVLRKSGKLTLKAVLGTMPIEYQKKYIEEHMAKYHQDS